MNLGWGKVAGVMRILGMLDPTLPPPEYTFIGAKKKYSECSLRWPILEEALSLELLDVETTSNLY